MPRLRDKGKAEYLLFVGCAGSFDRRNSEVLRAFCTLLNKAGVDYAVLGKEEGCCGDPARRVGHEYLFQMQAPLNIATFQKYDVTQGRHRLPPLLQHHRQRVPRFRPARTWRSSTTASC